MRALWLALALVALPLAAAQEHEHGGGRGAAMVLHDGPPDGRAVVGAYTHFGFALLDADAAPTPHQDAQFVVTQNGRVVFATTDTHEYDGLFGFDVVFTEPGPYQVVAMSGEMQTGVFEGVVVEPVDRRSARVELAATPQAAGSRALDLELAILDDAGALLPHTDAIVELRAARDGALAARAHLHIHDAPIRFSLGLGPETEHVAHVVAYQAFNRGREPDVPAVVAEFPLSFGALAAPAAPSPPLAPPSLLEQVGAKASADGLALHVMYDPNQQVGLGQVARVAAAVVDERAHAAQQHVDFAMTLAGPRGLVFATESGHEYDGVFELLFRPDAPGGYDGEIVATYNGTELRAPVHLLVVPPAVPLVAGTGLVTVSVEGLDALVAGEERNVTFLATSAAGPAKHSEVDVTLFQEGSPPLYQFKLHTHGSGATNAVVRLPHEGEWRMRIDAHPTVPEASVYVPALVSFDVAPAAGAPELAPEAVASLAKVPALPLGLLAAALGALALVARRR